MLIEFQGKKPKVSDKAFLAAGTQVIGAVTIEDYASIWFNAVIRGDIEEIFIAAHSNVQDCCVLHTSAGNPCRLGEYVTVTHGSVLHGCIIEEGALIGIGAILYDGVQVGKEAMIGAGAVLPAGMKVPPRSLVVGIPGKITRTLSDQEVEANRQLVRRYVKRAQRYKEETPSG